MPQAGAMETAPTTMAAVKRAVTLPRGTVTFLLTDLQDSTRCWQADSASMALAVARHYELIDEIVDACHGVRPEEQGEGDSVVAAFERPSDAVAAAVQLQLAMRAETWPGGLPISARMSVHRPISPWENWRTLWRSVTAATFVARSLSRSKRCRRRSTARPYSFFSPRSS